MERLSVDIDLCFLPLLNRADTLKQIKEGLNKLALLVKKRLGYHTELTRAHTQDYYKLIVMFDEQQIKVEPNYILRGSCYPSVIRPICQKAFVEFEADVSVLNLSRADVYAGKICAALSRQHPRDLFDVMLLLEHEGLTDEIRKAFVIYLASHNKAMNQMLRPTLIDMKFVYESQFQGMTQQNVSLDDLLKTRTRLIRFVQTSLTNNERKFLLSIKQNEPQWELMDIPHINQLPALKWKLENVAQMSPVKRKTEFEKLKRLLEK